MLLPTRMRPGAVLETVQGLLNLATRPNRIEILIAADPDDHATQQLRVPQSHLLVAPERYGYARLHEYYNDLATAATGDWLFTWNDDVHMLTPGWDEIVQAQPPGVLWPEANYDPEINTFPIWPSAWTRHLGHVSLDQALELWISEIGRLADALRRVPITLRHDRIHDDGPAADRDAVSHFGTFQDPAMVQGRLADAAKIRCLLAGASGTTMNDAEAAAATATAP